VPFNFSSLSGSASISSITDPADLFDALPNKSGGYGYLRAVQKSVLDAWSPRRAERDLVIKTNTGGGKTIAGLLILQVSLHEGKGPALYLAPDGHLAGRVVQEAENLGLRTVDDPRAPAFLSGDAICVTTMQILVNGRSRFGLFGSTSPQPVKVGTIVVDDAHASLTLAEQQTQLSIPSGHAVYEPLLDLFEDSLREQGENAFMNIKEGDRSAVLRVPFWTWRERQTEVLRLLRPHRGDDTFKWRWPLIADRLPLCQAVASADAIEIEPPCAPIEMIPSFADAGRRIYLTATLADDSVLITHFDADPKSVATSIFPDSAADLGDRLVLAPQELNPGVDEDEVRAFAADFAATENVVVLAPSWTRAKQWSAHAARTVSKPDEITKLVEELKTGHVGLVVIVNRYDGIDLPDGACRVLVLDGLPFAYSGLERREAAALRDSEAMVTRQLQRLEQGIGRGVRSREDRCVVLLLDPRLTQLVARADVADRLSPATRAQLRLSRQIAERLQGQGVAALGGVVQQVIDGDPDFRTVSREALMGVTYDPAHVAPEAEHMRKAYNAAIAGRADDAASHADDAVKAAAARGDERLAGWLGETLAAYLQPVDQVRAQSALVAATQRNTAVLRPIAGVSYKKIRPTMSQGRQASEYLTKVYATGPDMFLGVQAVLNDLVWDNDRTDDTEAALADLAEHLGMSAQRPERDFGIGSDVLWMTAPSTYAVIEAKSGATSSTIWKRDINQLAGSENWAKTEYGSAAQVVAVMMHPSHFVDKAGTPPAGARVLTKKKLASLKEAVLAFATALAQNDGYRDSAKVAEQLQQHDLQGSGIVNRYTKGAIRASK
jgi:hypothetical protein